MSPLQKLPFFKKKETKEKNKECCRNNNKSTHSISKRNAIIEPKNKIYSNLKQPQSESQSDLNFIINAKNKLRKVPGVAVSNFSEENLKNSVSVAVDDKMRNNRLNTKQMIALLESKSKKIAIDDHPPINQIFTPNDTIATGSSELNSHNSSSNEIPTQLTAFCKNETKTSKLIEISLSTPNLNLLCSTLNKKHCNFNISECSEELDRIAMEIDMLKRNDNEHLKQSFAVDVFNFSLPLLSSEYKPVDEVIEQEDKPEMLELCNSRNNRWTKKIEILSKKNENKKRGRSMPITGSLVKPVNDSISNQSKWSIDDLSKVSTFLSSQQSLDD